MALSTEQIRFWAATDVGRKRAHNEDNFLIDREIGLYVVADGMGGHAAGEVASAIAVRTIHEVVCTRRDLLELGPDGAVPEERQRHLLSMLDHAIQTASARIHAEAAADAAKRGMGTTCSLVVIRGRHAFVAHVGDSRIYLARGGSLNQVTEDHTVANELLRMGMVTPEQLDKIPRKNAITRAVGVYQTAEVDTLTIELLPSDEFLICSDGLAGYFDEGRGDILAHLSRPEGDRVVQGLIDFANACGGKDNITAIVIRLPAGDTSDSLRARRLALTRDTLRGMPLFSTLSDRELLRVMQIADVTEYAAGERVVSEGEPGEEMFVTLSGRLEVQRGGKMISQLTPGAQFGEMALIRSSPRSASVMAVEHSAVVIMRRLDFFEILRSEARLGTKLLWQFLNVLAERLDQTSRDLTTAREELSADAAKDQPASSKEDPFARPATEMTLGGLRLAYAGMTPPDPDDEEGDEDLEELGEPGDEAPTLDPDGSYAIDDSPSFDDAPAFASRIADPYTPGGVEEPAAHTTAPTTPVMPPPDDDDDEGPITAPKPDIAAAHHHAGQTHTAGAPQTDAMPAPGAAPSPAPSPANIDAILDDPNRVAALAARLDAAEREAGVPFDARATRPGRRKPRRPTLTSIRPDQLDTPAPKRRRRRGGPKIETLLGQPVPEDTDALLETMERDPATPKPTTQPMQPTPSARNERAMFQTVPIQSEKAKPKVKPTRARKRQQTLASPDPPPKKTRRRRRKRAPKATMLFGADGEPMPLSNPKPAPDEAATPAAPQVEPAASPSPPAAAVQPSQPPPAGPPARRRRGNHVVNETLPMNAPESLRSELDVLRKEFQQRLKESRKARKGDEPDGSN